MKTFKQLKINDILVKQDGDNGLMEVFYISKIDDRPEQGYKLFYFFDKRGRKSYCLVPYSFMTRSFYLPYFACKEALLKQKFEAVGRIKEKAKKNSLNQRDWRRIRTLRKTLKHIMYNG